MSPKIPKEDRRGETPEEREENAERMDIKRAKELLLGATNRWMKPPRLRKGERLEDTPRLILKARELLEREFTNSKRDEENQLPKDEIKKIGELLEQFDPNGFVKSLEKELTKTDIELTETITRAQAIETICATVGTIIFIALGVIGYLGDEKVTDQLNKDKTEIAELRKEIETLVKQCGAGEQIFTNEPNTNKSFATEESD